jgi:hypothetical protein
VAASADWAAEVEESGVAPRAAEAEAAAAVALAALARAIGALEVAELEVEASAGAMVEA